MSSLVISLDATATDGEVMISVTSPENQILRCDCKNFYSNQVFTANLNGNFEKTFRVPAEENQLYVIHTWVDGGNASTAVFHAVEQGNESKSKKVPTLKGVADVRQCTAGVSII